MSVEANSVVRKSVQVDKSIVDRRGSIG